jgi:DNA-binding beta-propeller fold protein YncE
VRVAPSVDAQSGQLLRTVGVGQGEHALAVHDRAGRVFVTNAGDASVSVLRRPRRGAPPTTRSVSQWL